MTPEKIEAIKDGESPLGRSILNDILPYAKANKAKDKEISKLKEENERYKKGLKAIKRHNEIMINGDYKLSSNWRIANDYLKPTPPKQDKGD